MGLFDFFKASEPKIVDAEDVSPRSMTLMEAGTTGLMISNGYVMEEMLRDLSGEQGRRVYREMTENDDTAGAMWLAFHSLLSAVKWTPEPNEKDTDGTGVDILKQVLKEMEDPFESAVSEALTMIIFGWAWLEICYKRNDDGSIGIQKLAPRAQETLLRWEVDPKGEVLGMWQQDNNSATTAFIPRSKSLHFRTIVRKNNPEGRSMFRNAYVSWYAKKQMGIIESVGVERELAGLPVIRIPQEIMSDPLKKDLYTKYVRMARDLRFNSLGGVVLPSDPFLDNSGRPSNNKMYDITLLSASGTRNIDVGNVIVRHQQAMARSILADFLILGSSSRGSFALSKSKTDIFLHSLQSMVTTMEKEFNRMVKSLWLINGYDMDTLPCLVAGKVAPVDLVELGGYVTALTGAGIMLGGDPETEKVLREAADLPGEYVEGGTFPNNPATANNPNPTGDLPDLEGNDAS